MVPAGVFIVKNSKCADAMPVRNDSGLWQAWKMSDGLFMVQPLDRDQEPWGAVHLLESRDFGAMLTLLPLPDGGSLKSSCADATDFLAMWCEQAIAEREALDADNPDSESPPGRDSWLAAAPSKTRMSPDEPVLVPSWHPDDLFSDDAPPVPEARAGGLPDPVKPETVLPGTPLMDVSSGIRSDDEDLFFDAHAQAPNPLDFMPALSFEIDSLSEPAVGASSFPDPPAAQAAPPVFGPAVTIEAIEESDPDTLEFQDDDAYAEARASRLEQHMREEFAALMERLDKGANPDIERDLSRLILRGAGFSWKQKFMFTEFGCTLRRKRLLKLALASHMRALGFAPTDEHILFNVARSEYELGNADTARMHLAKALKTAPAFDAAKRFLAFLEGSANRA